MSETTRPTVHEVGTGTFIGVDIGGTKIAAGVIDSAGTVLERSRVATPTNPLHLDDAVAEVVNDLVTRHTVHGVGIAAAGFVSRDRSEVVYAPNINWRDHPLRDNIARRVDPPVVVENDANAAGWGEFRFGAGHGVRHMVMLTLGTGVGGAIIADGELFRGGYGMAGELGHIRFTRDGIECGCGQSGCIEQYSSGRALQREITTTATGEDGHRLAHARQADGTIAGEDFARLVQDGDPGAVRALHHVASALGETCALLQSVIDPELFVLGGGVADLGTPLLDQVQRQYLAFLPARTHRPPAAFRLAKLGNDAGFIGAADLARYPATGTNPNQ